MTVTTYSDPSLDPYFFAVPAGVTHVQIEYWQAGGGGVGGDGDAYVPTGGGAGGYGKINSFAVLPGDVFTLYLPTGGAGGFIRGEGFQGNPPGNGGHSVLTHDRTGQIIAIEPETDGDNTPGGNGGLGSSPDDYDVPWDVKFTGGNGHAAGGGGSSAGPAGNGVNATGASGAIAPSGGGNGGSFGLSGDSPGGGGGGNTIDNFATHAGNGKMVFTYTITASTSRPAIQPMQIERSCSIYG